MHKLIFIIALLLFSISKPSLALEPTHEALPRCPPDSELTMPESGRNQCVATPEYYRIHIVEMGLCNDIDAFTKPDSPLINGSAWDIRSKCFKFFEASNESVPLLIENGVSQSFASISGGKISKPPNGSYTHGYALITGVIEIKGKVFFDTSTATGHKPGGSGAIANGLGNICWTSGSETYSWGVSPVTKCGTDITDYNESSVYFTHINGAGDCPSDGTDFHCNFYSTGDYSDVSEGLDPTTAILIDKDFNRATSAVFGSGSGQVKYLLGIATYNSPLIINDSTSAIDTQFKVTRGLYVGYGDLGYPGLSNQVNLSLLEWKTVTRAQ